jgi:hypothetical protein
MKPMHLLLAASLLLSSSAAWAQGRGNDKDRKEYKDKDYKGKKYKGYKDKDYKDNRDRDDDRDDDRRDRDRRYDDRDNGRNSRNGGLGGILGRVILPPNGTAGPRQLQGVPRGHYPPPGECRVWYPNRPPGHQPPPTSCQNLIGARLEPGAFILHGDRAYDSAYDWREEERQRPGSVGRDILDILFPRR